MALVLTGRGWIAAHGLQALTSIGPATSFPSQAESGNSVPCLQRQTPDCKEAAANGTQICFKGYVGVVWDAVREGPGETELMQWAANVIPTLAV